MRQKRIRKQVQGVKTRDSSQVRQEPRHSRQLSKAGVGERQPAKGHRQEGRESVRANRVRQQTGKITAGARIWGGQKLAKLCKDGLV